MIKTLSDVPEDYRGYFWDPNRKPILLHTMYSDETFDFELARKKREDTILQLNIAFFTGEGIKKSDDKKLLARLKYGSIVEGDHKHITFVDKETMKAYRMKDNSYYEGLLCPLEEITDFTFDHWCSGMEL